MVKKAYPEAPVLASADFSKPFLLETDASKLGLRAMLSQKQIDGQYHLVAHASQSLTIHEYHELSFNKTRVFSINVGDCRAVSGIPTLETIHPLTYIMTTPNLDATQHHWVESLVRFTFTIEYQKGQDNAATDTLSHIEARYRNHVHPGRSHHGNDRKSRLS